jgi:hypothetical protein
VGVVMQKSVTYPTYLPLKRPQPQYINLGKKLSKYLNGITLEIPNGWEYVMTVEYRFPDWQVTDWQVVW